jgi:hypothetical protein
MLRDSAKEIVDDLISIVSAAEMQRPPLSTVAYVLNLAVVSSEKKH